MYAGDEKALPPSGSCSICHKSCDAVVSSLAEVLASRVWVFLQKVNKHLLSIWWLLGMPSYNFSWCTAIQSKCAGRGSRDYPCFPLTSYNCSPCLVQSNYGPDSSTTPFSPYFRSYTWVLALFVHCLAVCISRKNNWCYVWPLQNAGIVETTYFEK